MVVIKVLESDSAETARAIGMDIGEFKAAALHIKQLQAPKEGTAFGRIKSISQAQRPSTSGADHPQKRDATGPGSLTGRRSNRDAPSADCKFRSIR
jgi:hypothetical protein